MCVFPLKKQVKIWKRGNMNKQETKIKESRKSKLINIRNKNFDLWDNSIRFTQRIFIYWTHLFFFSAKASTNFRPKFDIQLFWHPFRSFGLKWWKEWKAELKEILGTMFVLSGICVYYHHGTIRVLQCKIINLKKLIGSVDIFRNWPNFYYSEHEES